MLLEEAVLLDATFLPPPPVIGLPFLGHLCSLTLESTLGTLLRLVTAPSAVGGDGLGLWETCVPPPVPEWGPGGSPAHLLPYIKALGYESLFIASKLMMIQLLSFLHL